MATIKIILLLVQIISAIALILIIAVQTTKSEQGISSAGGGWGTIGGQASSSLHLGFDAQITKVTTWIAVTFFVVSFLTAWVISHLAAAAK